MVGVPSSCALLGGFAFGRRYRFRCYARWRQCKPSCNMCFLGPSRVHNSNAILVAWAIFAQLTTKCPYTLHWAALSPFKIAPSRGWSGSHLIHDSLGLSEPTFQTASWLVQPFLHSSSHSVHVLYLGLPLPPQNCPFRWVIWTPSNTWLRPHLIHGSMSPPEPTTQMASLDQLSRFWRVHDCDSPTDRLADRLRHLH